MRKLVSYSALALCMVAPLSAGTHIHASTLNLGCSSGSDRLHVAQCYFERGKKEEGDRQFGPAIADFSKAIQQKPKSYEAYFRRGIIYSYQSHYDLAIVDFTKVLSLNPRYGLAYVLRGGAFLAQGLYRGAISDETRAIALGGGYQYIAFAARGMAFTFAGRYAEAIRDISKAIALKHGPPYAYYNRALAYEEMGAPRRARMDYDMAFSLLSTAIAVHPKDGLLYVERGFVSERTGQEDEAIADEAQALALHCISPAYAHLFRALAYDRKGLRAKSAADLQAAVRIDRFSKLEWEKMKHLDAGSAAR